MTIVPRKRKRLPTAETPTIAAAPPRVGRVQLNVTLPLDVVVMVDEYSASSGLTRVQMVELALLRFIAAERKRDQAAA